MKKVFKITSLDGKKAILENGRGKNLAWPAEELPRDTKEGDTIILTMNKDPKTEEEKQLLAKNILNEVLNIEE